jgi:hypothetical protein
MLAEAYAFMSKWTKTGRDPGRTYLDEEKLQRKKRMLSRIFELVKVGLEAEPEVVVAAKEADPGITPEKLSGQGSRSWDHA